MVNKRTIFFNEEFHKYTDQFNNVYTSATTLIGKYVNPFDVDKMARLCHQSGKRGNRKYMIGNRAKTEAELKLEWRQMTVEACDKGTIKHNTLEQAVKNSNNYNKVIGSGNTYINDRLFTLDDTLENSIVGEVDLSYFEKAGIKEEYPSIYKLLQQFVEKGFKIHSEIGVYCPNFIISGLIDILVINPNTKEFWIIDWKTNKAPLRFEAGYFKKDDRGLLTNDFIRKFDYFLYPLNRIEDSVGNHYTLQLSIYDYLAEGFGYKCKGNILCHIRDIIDNNGDKVNEVVEMYPIKYWRDEVHTLFTHYNEQRKVANQYKLL